MDAISIQRTTLKWMLGYALLFVVIVQTQIRYDKIVNPEIIWAPKTSKYIMPAFIINNFSFGFKNVLADFYWVNIIQDFAGWDHTDSFYIEEFKNLVTLDPKFAYPYLFGILTVPSEKNQSPKEVEKIEPVAKVGIQYLSYNWEIPFYLATEFHLYKDKDKALSYMQTAVSRPIIPDIVQKVYTLYLKKTLSGGSASQAFIKTIYDTTESETTKKIIKEGMLLSDLTQAIQSVVQNYKIKYGVYPESLNDLVRRQMIEVTPALQSEFNVLIDKKTGIVEIKPKLSE